MNEFKINGITCGSCVAKISDALLENYPNLQQDDFSIIKETGILQFKSGLSPFKTEEELAGILPKKYSVQNIVKKISDPVQKSKLVELYPLFLIFSFLFLGTLLIKLNYKLSFEMVMPLFMGGFFFVFSFFKFLDLKGFSETFSMYDPIAAKVLEYGKIYPFLELLIGIGYLGFYEEISLILNVATIVILGMTTFGVIKVLVDKRKIQCACLGTALNLPMTEATFIENLIMIFMAGFLLF